MVPKMFKFRKKKFEFYPFNDSHGGVLLIYYETRVFFGLIKMRKKRKYFGEEGLWYLWPTMAEQGAKKTHKLNSLMLAAQIKGSCGPSVSRLEIDRV